MSNDATPWWLCLVFHVAIASKEAIGPLVPRRHAADSDEACDGRSGFSRAVGEFVRYSYRPPL